MSGAILGECWVCNEFVYEGEWSEEWLMKHDEFIHENCEANAKRLTELFRNKQLTKLTARVKRLEEAVFGKGEKLRGVEI